MKQRRILSRGIQCIQHRGQQFVLDVDEAGCLLGGVRVARGNGGDGVPDIEHLVARQRIVAAILEAGVHLS